MSDIITGVRRERFHRVNRFQMLQNLHNLKVHRRKKGSAAPTGYYSRTRFQGVRSFQGMSCTRGLKKKKVAFHVVAALMRVHPQSNNLAFLWGVMLRVIYCIFAGFA